MTKSINAIAVTHRDRARCCKRIIAAHKLNADRAAGGKSVSVDFSKRRDRGRAANTRDRQHAVLNQLWRESGNGKLNGAAVISFTDDTADFGRLGFQSVPASCEKETTRGSFGLRPSEPLSKS